MTVLAADPSATLKMPAGAPLADQVRAQLKGDYPPSALSWVDSVAWTGPSRVPLAQIDFAAGQADWDAAEADKAKLAAFRKRLQAVGWWKPAVVLRLPGKPRLFVVDGHGRTSAAKALGMPVLAYVGTAKTATGAWTGLHSQQLANEGEAIDLSAQTARLAVTPAPAGKPGGPGLWRVKGQQLPPYFQNVRNALERSGKTPEEAYRLTWGAIRRWARGGGKAHPEVVAAAQAALADLAAKSARAHAHANDREALELAWDAALHPRVGAGASAGGQFTKGQQGQQQSPARKPGKHHRGHHRGHHLSGQRAARARQLRAQAATFREHAAQLRTQARALEGLIHAAEAKQKAAKRAAARSAAAAASGKQGARKVAARTSTKTHRRKTVRRHGGPSLPSMRLKAFELRSQARTLDAAARKLDGQARRL